MSLSFAAAQSTEPAAPAAQTAAPDAQSAASEQEETAAAGAQSAVPAATDFFAEAPEPVRALVAKAEELAAQGKWLSAWKALSEFDEAGADPFVLAEKIRIALDGYAQTAFHMAFGFVDLEEGQSLDLARMEAAEDTEPVEFNPSELAKAIEDKGGAIPPVLSMKLGDFYHTVWRQYQGQWFMDDDSLLNMSAEYYERAAAYEVYTARTLARQSELLFALQRFDAAETVILKGLELEPNNSELLMRLADVYIAAGRYAEVYPLVDRIIETAADAETLNDGYITAIKAGLATQDKEQLEKYLSGFEKSLPGEYIPGLVRHIVAVRLGDAAAADSAADAVTEAFPGNPDVVRSILSTWLSEGDTESGFRYLDRMIAKAGTDEVLATLYFYRALLNGDPSQGQSADKIALALEDLAKAEQFFTKAYPAGHEVFGIIEEIKGQLTALVAAPAAAPGADTAPTTPGAAPAADQTQSQAPAAQDGAPAAQPAPAQGAAGAEATSAATN